MVDIKHSSLGNLLGIRAAILHLRTHLAVFSLRYRLVLRRVSTVDTSRQTVHNGIWVRTHEVHDRVAFGCHPLFALDPIHERRQRHAMECRFEGICAKVSKSQTSMPLYIAYHCSSASASRQHSSRKHSASALPVRIFRSGADLRSPNRRSHLGRVV